jgi:hypothetical protein
VTKLLEGELPALLRAFMLNEYVWPFIREEIVVERALLLIGPNVCGGVKAVVSVYVMV